MIYLVYKINGSPSHSHCLYTVKTYSAPTSESSDRDIFKQKQMNVNRKYQQINISYLRMIFIRIAFIVAYVFFVW